MNELTGKKDSGSTTLSFEDQRSLMTGARTTGPTLAIGGAHPAPNAPTSFDNTAAMNTNNAYVSEIDPKVNIVERSSSSLECVYCNDIRCKQFIH